MKGNSLSFVAALSILLSSCGNMKKENDAAASKNDSVAYKWHFALKHSEPPYDVRDTIIIVKFANDSEFTAERIRLGTSLLDYEKVK